MLAEKQLKEESNKAVRIKYLKQFIFFDRIRKIMCSSQLQNKIASWNELQTLLKTIKQGCFPIKIIGINNGFKGFFLKEFLKKIESNILLVLPTEKEIEERYPNLTPLDRDNIIEFIEKIQNDKFSANDLREMQEIYANIEWKNDNNIYHKLFRKYKFKKSRRTYIRKRVNSIYI